MPSISDLIRRMILTHEKGDRDGFHDAVRDLVAEEKRKNHHVYARDIERLLFNGIGSDRLFHEFSPGYLPADSPRDGERGLELVEIREPKRHIDELVLSERTRERVERLIAENRQAELLESYALTPCRKILFYGMPGCGKTACAEVIASSLYMPLVIVRFDGVISSYLGDTAANLRRVFDFIKSYRCVALFDEFDAVGKSRTDIEEHGELKRAVNSFLQILDGFHGESVIVCATNHEKLLDTAVWRRFDEVIEFPMPSLREREELFRLLLRHATNVGTSDVQRIAKQSEGFSHSDIEQATRRAMKTLVLAGERAFSIDYLSEAIKQQYERKEENRNKVGAKTQSVPTTRAAKRQSNAGVKRTKASTSKRVSKTAQPRKRGLTRRKR